jgi:hypothetical protein
MSEIARKQITDRLLQFRAGRLPPKEIASLAADIGRDNVIEAIPDLEALLYHPDEIVRYNAIGSLGYKFARTQISRIDRLVEILRSDPDEDCRRIAASVFGVLYAGSKDKEIENILSRAVRDQTENPGVRIFAFTALQNIAGIPRTKQPDPNKMNIEEIDWDFVRSLADPP